MRTSSPLFLPSVTTLQLTQSTWESKLCEVVSLKLPAIGLFLTGLSDADRNRLLGYLCSLKRSHDFTIPFVHAVASMEEWEYNFFLDQFDTEAFNLHPRREFPLQHSLSPSIRSRIFIENSSFRGTLRPADMEGFAGICFDLSHLEDARRADPRLYDSLLSLLDQFPVGANHISAVRRRKATLPMRRPASSHVFDAEHDLSYLAGLPPETISGVCALELENSLAEQVDLLPIAAKLLQAPDAPKRVFVRAGARG